MVSIKSSGIFCCVLTKYSGFRLSYLLTISSAANKQNRGARQRALHKDIEKCSNFIAN